jgi:type VI secretion system secreted protein Hcp
MNLFRTPVLLLGCLLCAASARAAFDTYLKIEGVDGQSIDRNHPKWSDIYSFAQGVTKGPVQPDFSELCMQKLIDTSTPVLAQACAQGRQFPSATLELIAVTPANPVRFYQIVLSNVVVSSISEAGSAGTDIRPLEALCLRYSRISWTYTELDSSGAPKGDIKAWWDLALNTGDSTPRTGFKVTATQADSRTMTLSWVGHGGKTYNILGSATVNGTYDFVQSVTADSETILRVPVSMSGGSKFFRVQEMP